MKGVHRSEGIPPGKSKRTGSQTDGRRRHERRSEAGTAVRLDERRVPKGRRAARERRPPRVEKALPVRLEIGDSGTEVKNLTLVSKNIGKSGMLIEAETQEAELIPLLGSRSYSLNIEIMLPEQDIKIKTAAQVVRVNPGAGQAPKKFGIGLKFVEISEERKAELAVYLNELIKTDPAIVDLQPSTALEKDKFKFHKTLYLTDTNAMGNAYFARYFDWQGMAREEFFRRIIPDPIAFFNSGMRILTLSATMEYKSELGLYDEIEIDVRTSNIKRASFELIFNFTNKKTDTMVGIGRQRLAFSDRNGQIIPIPDEFKKKGHAYLLE